MQTQGLVQHPRFKLGRLKLFAGKGFLGCIDVPMITLLHCCIQLVFLFFSWTSLWNRSRNLKKLNWMKSPPFPFCWFFVCLQVIVKWNDPAYCKLENTRYVHEPTQLTHSQWLVQVNKPIWNTRDTNCSNWFHSKRCKLDT